MKPIFHSLQEAADYFKTPNAVWKLLEENSEKNIYAGDFTDYDGIKVPGLLLYSYWPNTSNAVLLSLSSYEKDNRYDFSGQKYAFCIIQVVNNEVSKCAYRVNPEITFALFKQFLSEIEVCDLGPNLIDNFTQVVEKDSGIMFLPENEAYAWEYLYMLYRDLITDYFETYYFNCDTFQLFYVYKTTEKPNLYLKENGHVYVSLSYNDILLPFSEATVNKLKSLYEEYKKQKEAIKAESLETSKSKETANEELSKMLSVFEKHLLAEEEIESFLKQYPFQAPSKICKEKKFWSDIIARYLSIFETTGKKNVIDAICLTLGDWISSTDNSPYQTISNPFAADDIRLKVNIAGKEYTFTKEEVLKRTKKE